MPAPPVVIGSNRMDIGRGGGARVIFHLEVYFILCVQMFHFLSFCCKEMFHLLRLLLFPTRV